MRKESIGEGHQAVECFCYTVRDSAVIKSRQCEPHHWAKHLYKDKVLYELRPTLHYKHQSRARLGFGFRL